MLFSFYLDFDLFVLNHLLDKFQNFFNLHLFYGIELSVSTKFLANIFSRMINKSGASKRGLGTSTPF